MKYLLLGVFFILSGCSLYEPVRPVEEAPCYPDEVAFAGYADVPVWAGGFPVLVKMSRYKCPGDDSGRLYK